MLRDDGYARMYVCSRSTVYPTSSTEICSSTASSQADRAGRNQCTRGRVEGQVDREEDVAAVTVEVHREVHPVRG